MTANQRSDDPIERFYQTANPNPSREGCPGRAVLERLANHSLPGDHPARAHLGGCSPCFVEFSDLQEKWRRRRRLIGATGAVAASLLVAAFLVRPHSHENGMAAVLNLEGESVVRGSESGREQLQRLPLSDLDLSIYLPVGSEPGLYEVAVEGGAASSATSVEGRAEVNSAGLTLLRARLDLRGSEPGARQLLVRRKSAGARARVYRVFLGAAQSR